MSSQESEAERAKEIGTQLDGARDRASAAEIERNRLALAKAVKAALWVTEARLNLAVPELLKMAQLWVDQQNAKGGLLGKPIKVVSGDTKTDRVEGAKLEHEQAV